MQRLVAHNERLKMGLSTEQRKAQARNLCMREYGFDPETLRKDAERYRWLRDVASGGDWEHIGQTTDPTNTDARIDECMAAYRAVGAA